MYDIQCGAKLVRCGPIVREIFEPPFSTRWTIGVELPGRYLWVRREEPRSRTRERIYELVLPECQDVEGSKLTFRVLSVTPVELARIWRRYGRKL